MEETKLMHQLNFFVSSNRIQELNMQLFTVKDEPLDSFTIKNYTSHSIRLNKDLTSFYCVASCPLHHIQEEFQCTFSENVKQNDRISILKRYSGFKLKIESQIIEEYRIISDEICPQQQLFYNIAIQKLRVLQKKIIKKMQLDELAKPIQSRTKKSNLKNKSMNKSKTNFNLQQFRQNSSLSKYSQRKQKRQGTVKVSQTVIDSEIEDSQGPGLSNFKRRGKHYTYTANNNRQSQTPSVKSIQKQEIQPDLPEYQRVFRKFNKGVNQMGLKTHKHTYSSILQQIQRQTQCQLLKQKQFISLLQTTTHHLTARTQRSSLPSSKSKLKPVHKSSTISIYRTKGVKNFRKRKIL